MELTEQQIIAFDEYGVPDTATQPCEIFLNHGQCCCLCEHHLPVNYHCSTEPKPDPDPGNCVCNIQKGWACHCPIENVVFDNWPEHSVVCELYSAKDIGV